MKKKILRKVGIVFFLILPLFVQMQEPVYGRTGVRTTVKGNYYESVAGKTLTAKAIYDDEFFFLTEKSSYKKGEYLQGELAKLSMLASATVYNEDHVRQFLKACKFTTALYSQAAITADDNDHVSFAVGIKKLGKDTLVAVIVKGTGDNYEWVSNFNLGTGKVHSGFSLAEKEVYQKLKRILTEQKVSGNVRFWVTGHSRGAAVGNLLAKRLTDKYGKDYVYAYTFATPRVATSAKSAGYENIFNFLNPGDFVTEVAPKAWGYARYGKDIVLASDKKKEMKKLFKKRLGKDAFGNAITYGGYTAAGKKSILEAFLNYGGSCSSDYYKPRGNGVTPAIFFQRGIALLLAGDEASGMVNILIYSYGDPQAQSVIGTLTADGGVSLGFAHAHCLTGYLCWVEAMYE